MLGLDLARLRVQRAHRRVVVGDHLRLLGVLLLEPLHLRRRLRELRLQARSALVAQLLVELRPSRSPAGQPEELADHVHPRDALHDAEA